MTTKIFELRDRGTFIPVMAVRLDMGHTGSPPEVRYLISRAGYGSHYNRQCQYVFLMKMDEPNRCEYNPAKWNDRTFQTAHMYIKDEWSSLHTGQVIDVEFILGETKKPKKTEMLQEWE